MMFHKKISKLAPLMVYLSAVNATHSTEVLNNAEREFNSGFHSFCSPSVMVYEADFSRPEVKSIIIKLNESDSENIDQDLDLLEKTSYSLDLSFRDDLTQERLKKISQNPLIKGLDLEETDLDNKGLEILSNMPLRFFDISRNRFNDAGMPFISRLNQLEELIIRSNKITPIGIRHIQSFDKLRVLDASCTYLKNEGIKIISELTTIEDLSVRACGFNDDALDYFLAMPSLKQLNISGNKSLTPAGLRNFLSKAENLVVKYDQLT